MLVVLLGPKGSGKSFVGNLLNDRFGVTFLLVEPLWKLYYERCRARAVSPDVVQGIAEVHPIIRRAFAAAPHLAIETTGASEPILTDLLTIAPREQTLVIRVRAPLATCLARISARDQGAHIPVEPDTICKTHALSEMAPIAADVELDNSSATVDELVQQLATGLQRAGLKLQAGAA